MKKDSNQWPRFAARVALAPFDVKCKATKEILPAGSVVVLHNGFCYKLDSSEGQRLLAKALPHVQHAHF